MGSRLAVLGTKLMDLYTGTLPPAEIGRLVLDRLAAEGRLAAGPYAAWLEGQGGYAVVELSADGSRWVLRHSADPARYVHLHPGRWSPHTVRVRANVLKTAFLALVHAGLSGGDPMGRAVINAVRREFLGLPPVGADPEEEVGLGAVLALLRE